jgi:hypothetical protein
MKYFFQLSISCACFYAFDYSLIGVIGRIFFILLLILFPVVLLVLVGVFIVLLRVGVKLSILDFLSDTFFFNFNVLLIFPKSNVSGLILFDIRLVLEKFYLPSKFVVYFRFLFSFILC